MGNVRDQIRYEEVWGSDRFSIKNLIIIELRAEWKSERKLLERDFQRSTRSEGNVEWSRVNLRVSSISPFTSPHFNWRLLSWPSQVTRKRKRCWKGPQKRKISFYHFSIRSFERKWTQVKTVYSLRLFQSSAKSSENSQTSQRERQYKRARAEVAISRSASRASSSPK